MVLINEQKINQQMNEKTRCMFTFICIYVINTFIQEIEFVACSKRKPYDICFNWT